MQILKQIGLIGALVLSAILFVTPASYADVSNQATEITFAQSVRIPGQVLPAGTYWFEVVDANYGLTNTMQIFNADHTELLAQVHTETADVSGGFGQEVTINGVRWPTGKLVMTVAEARNQQPATLLTWYYPGRTDGHRFIYSSQRETQLDEEQHLTIAVRPGDTVHIGASAAAFE